MQSFIKINCFHVIVHERNIMFVRFFLKKYTLQYLEGFSCSRYFTILEKTLFSRNCLPAKSRSFFSILCVLDAKGVLGEGRLIPPLNQKHDTPLSPGQVQREGKGSRTDPARPPAQTG
jgi:hypothetical protein